MGGARADHPLRANRRTRGAFIPSGRRRRRWSKRGVRPSRRAEVGNPRDLFHHHEEVWKTLCVRLGCARWRRGPRLRSSRAAPPSSRIVQELEHRHRRRGSVTGTFVAAPGRHGGRRERRAPGDGAVRACPLAGRRAHHDTVLHGHASLRCVLAASPWSGCRPCGSIVMAARRPVVDPQPSVFERRADRVDPSRCCLPCWAGPRPTSWGLRT